MSRESTTSYTRRLARECQRDQARPAVGRLGDRHRDVLPALVQVGHGHAADGCRELDLAAEFAIALVVGAHEGLAQAEEPALIAVGRNGQRRRDEDARRGS